MDLMVAAFLKLSDFSVIENQKDQFKNSLNFLGWFYRILFSIYVEQRLC